MTPKNAQPDDRLALRPAEAARLLGISARTLWTLTHPRGPIPCVRPSGPRGPVLYPVRALHAWLEAELAQVGQHDTGVEGQD